MNSRLLQTLSGLAVSTMLATSAHAQSSAPAAPAGTDGQASSARPSTPSLSASAQTSDTSLGDIVVTARRVSESLQSVPVAITAISSEQLRQQQIVNVPDLQRVTPSLTVTTTTRGSSTPVYMIRGQRAFSVNTLTDPAVSVYFADVGQALPTGTSLSLYDLSSVQVLKGSQGTLFGRNTTGGAVLITPRAPSFDFGGYVQATLGDYNRRYFEGALNVPITSTLAIRAAGTIQRRDGYLDNAVTGAHANDQHAESARLSLRWKPAGGFETTFVGGYFKDDVTNATKLFRIDPTRIPAALGPFKPILSAQFVGALATVNALGRYQYNDFAPEYSRDRVWSLENTSTYDLGSGFSVKNIAGYRHIETQYAVNTEGSPLGVIYYPSTVDAKQFSNELQLLGNFGNIDFVAGLFYFQINGKDQANSFQFNSLAPIVPTAFPSLSIQSYDTRNRSYAAFGDVNWKLDALAEGLSLSAGVRLTHDVRNVTYHNRSSGGATPTVFRCILTGVTGLPNSNDTCATDARVSFTEPTYDASLNFKASDKVLLYAAFRHGYRSGGFNTNPPTIALIPTFVFGPEKVNEYEVGLKSDFSVAGLSGRLNLAAYHSDYSDIQRSSNVVLPGTATISSRVVNAARAHINGGEAELTLQPTRNLKINANAALIIPKYESWTDIYAVGGVPTVVDISDSKFAFVPKWQFNASVAYTLPLAETAGKITVSGNYYHQTSIQTGEVNTANCGPDGLYPFCNQRNAALPGYGIFNARVDWRNVADKGFDLAVYVENVGDKFYSNDALNALGAIGFASYTVAPPRMFAFELRVPFGAERH